MRAFFTLLVLILASTSAPAQHGMTGNIQVTKVWSRAMPPVSKTGAIYLTLENTGDKPERLLSASTTAAERAELHTHLHENGVMKMRKIEALELPANGEVVFKPGGLHIMLMGLKAPLKEGDSFPLTLRFEHAGEAVAEVQIMAPGAKQMRGGMKHGDIKKQGHGTHTNQ